MKIKMYTSALAILVALSACNSSNDTVTPTAPAPEAVPPAPEAVPTGPVTKTGTTATFMNDADARTTSLTRSSGFRIAAQADATNPIVGGAITDLAAANKAQDDAETLNARLAALPNLDTANLVAEANQIIDDFNLLHGETDVADVALNDSLAPSLASTQAIIDGALMATITAEEKDLAVAYYNEATTAGYGSGEITLADGTVLQTESFGFVHADKDQAFVSSRLVAAYEEDSQGRITRVAFVEASGSDFVENGAMGTYVANGVAAFAVKVDGGFFNTLTGTSDVTINLATESGNVTAVAGGGRLNYGSDVVFDPATGAFAASNGEIVYTTTPGTFGSTGSETITAQNAAILGQLHGDMKDANFGADYTGLVTATTDRMEAIGGIIGQQSDGL